MKQLAMTNSLPRGLRNNNPGNIRRSAVRYCGEVVPSQDTAFKQFQSIAWGYRAVFVLLDSYRRRGLLTLRQMIARYAPPAENDTEVYLRQVAQRSGLAPDAPVDTLDPEQMVPIVAAMSGVENGRPASRSDVEAGWQLFVTCRP